MGKTATSANKAVKYVDRPGEVCGEVRLVKGWFGIGQEVSIRTLDIQLSFLKKLKAQGCHSSLSRKFQDWWGFFQDSWPLSQAFPPLKEDQWKYWTCRSCILWRAHSTAQESHSQACLPGCLEKCGPFTVRRTWAPAQSNFWETLWSPRS